MAYCEVQDLLIGDIPTSAALDPVKYVNDAADEIDSKIGFRYSTPIPTAGTPRPVVLLLKRLNAHLASGRLILAATIAVEDDRLNAYGQSLVEEVEASLALIASGGLLLPGADANEDVPTVAETPTVLLGNVDAESSVEAFYDRIANPDYHFVANFNERDRSIFRIGGG